MKIMLPDVQALWWHVKCIALFNPKKGICSQHKENFLIRQYNSIMKLSLYSWERILIGWDQRREVQVSAVQLSEMISKISSIHV